MKNVFNSAQVLINIAQRAQAKGLLTIDEAVTTKQAIDIQVDYYKQLGEQLQATEGEPQQVEQPAEKPAEKPKGKAEAKK